MENTKKIYISDSYALNTGDLGILFATLKELEVAFPNSDLSIESSHPNFLKQYKEVSGYLLFPRIFDIHLLVGSNSRVKILAIVKGLTDSTLFLFWAILQRIGINTLSVLPKSRRRQALALLEADIILSSGGGFLSSYYNYQFRIQLYLISFLLKKKVVIFAQSVGPFKTLISKIIVPLFLKKMSLITIREEDSYEYLKSTCPGIQVELVADIAFLLNINSKIESTYERLLKEKNVAFCIKNTSNIEYFTSIYSQQKN